MTSTWQAYNRIGRPLEAHNTRSADDYVRIQADIIARNAAAYPGRAWRAPFQSDQIAQPIINAGRWVVLCPECGNAPSYDPEWQLACCCECGAIFAKLAPPADWEAAEAVLMQRQAMVNRNWLPSTEAITDLGAENIAHEIEATRRDQQTQSLQASLDRMIATLAAVEAEMMRRPEMSDRQWQPADSLVDIEVASLQTSLVRITDALDKMSAAAANVASGIDAARSKGGQ